MRRRVVQQSLLELVSPDSLAVEYDSQTRVDAGLLQARSPSDFFGEEASEATNVGRAQLDGGNGVERIEVIDEVVIPGAQRCQNGDGCIKCCQALQDHLDTPSKLTILFSRAIQSEAELELP